MTFPENPSQYVGWFSFFVLFTFVCVITSRLIEAEPLSSANDRSRWMTVYSLVEDNTYQIDNIRQRSGWDSIDIVRHDDHFYSTKPPLLPRLVAELYRLVKWSTGLNLTDNTATVARIILFLVNIIPMAIAMWLMCRLIRRDCTNLFGQLFLMVAVCWATLLAPFLVVLNNHTVGATFIIYSLYLAISILVEQQRAAWRFALCGLFAAFAVCNELPAAAYGLALFCLLLRADVKKTLLVFVPMSLIPIGGFFLTTYHATGGWKPFYLYYGTEKYEFVHDGKPSYWLLPQGVDQAKDSFATYFFHCTVGHHGILSLTPIFLLTVLTWLSVIWMWRCRLRIVHLLGLALTAIVLGFYMTKTENYNYGGVSVALRWILWLVPFWILTMIPVLNRFGRATWIQLPALLFLAVSIFSAWYPANSPWTQPWLFTWMQDQGWIDYSSPRPKFDHKVYSWIGDVPTGDEVQHDYWIELRTVEPDGSVRIVRLEDRGPTAGQQRRILVTRDGIAVEYLFNREKLKAGLAPVQFIFNADGSTLSEADQAFFRGVPKRRAYACSRIRYIGTGIRVDAFKAVIGYTYVDITKPEIGKFRHQRDIWFTEEVPFGVFQFEDRVTDLKSKAILTRKLWRITAAGKYLPREGI